MSVPFTIEPATWRDLGDLRRVEKECFGDDAWPLLDLVGALTVPGEVHIKAVADGKMVGFVGGNARRSEGVGWVTTLGVLAPYRRQGIARSLLAACEAELNLPHIRLSLRRTNFDALFLYQRAGYRLVDTWARYYSDGEDALVMEKVLKKDDPVR